MFLFYSQLKEMSKLLEFSKTEVVFSHICLWVSEFYPVGPRLSSPEVGDSVKVFLFPPASGISRHQHVLCIMSVCVLNIQSELCVVILTAM